MATVYQYRLTLRGYNGDTVKNEGFSAGENMIQALLAYAEAHGATVGQIHRIPRKKGERARPCIATKLGWLFAHRER